MTAWKRLKRHQANCHTIFRMGGFIPAAAYLSSAVTGSRSPIRAGSMWLRPNTPDAIVASAMRKGEFDEPIRAASPLRHNFILDCGGYIGTAAVAFAEAFPDATIVTVEPSPDNFAILCQNVAAHPHVCAIQAAISALGGTATLSSRGTGEWGYTIEAGRDVVCSVPMVTIPELMARFGATGIDIVKLDIEGAERDVLLAGADWLPRTRVLFAELHDRINPGCSDAFANASAGRRIVECAREKVMSVA